MGQVIRREQCYKTLWKAMLLLYGETYLRAQKICHRLFLKILLRLTFSGLWRGFGGWGRLLNPLASNVFSIPAKVPGGEISIPIHHLFMKQQAGVAKTLQSGFVFFPMV
jgi:hypothetical protein